MSPRENRSSGIEKVREFESLSLSSRLRCIVSFELAADAVAASSCPTPTSSSSSSPQLLLLLLLSDSFGTCSSADVTLGCLVEHVFCAVERHNDTGQKLSMRRRIGFHACIRRAPRNL